MKIEKLAESLTPIIYYLKRYLVLIFVLIIGCIIGFMTYRIGVYSNVEPSEEQIEERISSLRTVKLDEDAVEKIQALKDQNINIESLFNNGRDNPFE